MDKFFTSQKGFLQGVTLPGCASHRVYSRLMLDGALSEGGRTSVIGVENDNAAENATFAAMSEFFRSKGVNVPEVYAVSDDGLMYVQQDLGDDILRSHLDDMPLLKRTLKALVQMQQAGRGFDYSKCFATKQFGPRIVDFDLNYFKYCFLKNCGVEFDENLLQDDFDAMRTDLCAVHGDTFLYRDFQSRNVMVSGGEPWFIDFQGGFRGPFYYDLCSFVYQASAGFSTEKRAELIDAYYEYLFEYETIGRGEFDSDVQLFALFRCLQTLGCYGFRGLVEKKQYFIDSIPAGLENFRALAGSGKYPYLKQLADELDSDSL